MARKAATRRRKGATGRTRKTAARSTSTTRKATAGTRARKPTPQGSPSAFVADRPPEVEIRMDHQMRHRDLRALRPEDEDGDLAWVAEDEEEDSRSSVDDEEDERMVREDEDDEEEW